MDLKFYLVNNIQNIGMNCEGNHEILFMNFNQDGSSLSAGCKSGFYLYGLANSTEKLDVSSIEFNIQLTVSDFVI